MHLDKKIRIGHLSTFYHTSLLMMAKPELCRCVEAEIEWKLFGTGPAIVNAFMSGELDMAYIGLPPAITGIDKGAGIVCIAGGHMEGTVICAKSRYRGFPGTPDISDIMGQFSGGTIGVPGRGSIHDVILRDCLASAGLAGEISVKNFPWADMVLEAVVKEEVAAAFGTPALAVAVKRYAGGKVLYPPHLLRPNNPSYGIVADRQFLDSHGAAAEQFLMAHENATRALREEPAASAARIAGHIGFIDADFVLETIALSPKYCGQLTDDYIACTMSFVHTLKEQGFITRLVAEEEIFDCSMISRIHTEKEHYSEGIRLNKEQN